MMNRLDKIAEAVSKIESVSVTSPFKQEGEVIVASVLITVDSASLPFSVRITSSYPLQFHGSESIQFYNPELRAYDHVMQNGLICIHNHHSPTLSEKLFYDFESLKAWVRKFYIKKDSESHYEHIVVSPSSLDTYIFTEVTRNFLKHEYGVLKYSRLSSSKIQGAGTATFLIQQFELKGNEIKCNWSTYYQSLPVDTGAFIFIGDAPVIDRKFAFDNWQEFESIFSQDFLIFLNNICRKSKKDFPLLVGYKISATECHWQVIIIKRGDFPVYGEKVHGSAKYIGKLADKLIKWGQTKNSSYSYFFGRGAFHPRITGASVLIIGVGAIGSMVAKSLVRGGCRKIALSDYDAKHPENVCRSEYIFKTGTTAKVLELSDQLTSISPFVEVSSFEYLTDAAKYFIDDEKKSAALSKSFNSYDLIFDCSTDDDVAYILEKYDVSGQVFNMSITNRAKALVCAVSPNLYEWLKTIFKKLDQAPEDLYNPTGCWDPTFKASYTDIAVLVQYGLKQINLSYEKGVPPRSFFLETDDENDFNIKLTQY